MFKVSASHWRKEQLDKSNLGKVISNSGKYACASFELSSDEYQAAWDWMYKNWLPTSGYIPDDRLSFETFSLEKNKNNKNKHKQFVDICIPVKPMGY
jgi:AraC family transcriptional regulator